MARKKSLKKSAQDFPERGAVKDRHELHCKILAKAEKNLEVDVVEAYAVWFDNRDYGRQLGSLLGFQSISELLPSPPIGAFNS